MAAPERTANDGALDRSLAALRRLRARVEAVEGAQRAPIAVIGIGCRLPGGSEDIEDPAAFWRLLEAGGDAVTPPPPGRETASDPPLEAGWLRRVDGFDARFFGVSPREAVRMDPQQRLFLEVAWESLEHAGVPPSSLAGTAAGVFAGVNSSDYFWLQLAARDAADTYTITGATHTSVPNRLSYQLDLKGPSLAVDTACSSSLVAVHLACQSLRAGESDLALAGGVNLFLSADVTAVHACGMPLSPAGRSKAFDAGADGYARGEGCGIVVLKRLHDAEAAGDRVWAVIRGTAVNQDGRTHGVAAPNGTAQRAVIRQALNQAAVPPASIGYIEAHGTGTELGDPIEAEALAEVYGEGRTADRPAWLGAIKTNVGHLEAAAGIAGLIKAVLTLEHESVPRNLHFRRLNPHIRLDGRLRVADRPRAWPRTPAAPRRAAVSSFGAGGTNAHVILEEAPSAGEPGTDASPEAAADGPFVLALSADRPASLSRVAARWSAFLGARAPEETSDPALRDACATAASRRDHLAHRAVVVGDSRSGLVRRLDALARDQPEAGSVRDRVGRLGASRGLVFAFAGMGAHGVDQGSDLLAREPAFRRAFRAVDDEVRRQAGWSVAEALARDPARAPIDVTQPTFFALQIGLAALWRSWGVVPDAVIGHSLGEVAAARVAGALSLEDAVRVVLARSRQLATIAGDGAMVLAGLGEEDAAALAAEHEAAHGAALDLAVIMGYRASVLAGPRHDVERVAAALKRRNVFSRTLDVDIAFHSRRVDPLAAALGEQLAGLAPRPARTRFCSTVTGDALEGAELDAVYWARNLRQPVRFWPALRALQDRHHGLFLELGGHPVLLPAIRQDFEHRGRPVVAVPSLVRDGTGAVTLRTALGALHCAGRSVDWRAVVGRRPPARVPTYPWQRRRYWFDRGVGDRSTPEAAPDAQEAAGAVAPAPARAAAGSLARRLRAVAAFQRREVLLGHVLDAVASVLALSGDDAELEPSQGFFQLGMDSRMAVELTERLTHDLGHPLPSTVTFEHPTSEALCDAMERLLEEQPEQVGTAPVRVDAAPGDGPVATAGDGAETRLRDGVAGEHAEIELPDSDDVVALLRDQIAALEAETVP